MDDFTLVKDCVKGNPASQKKLFEKFAPKMLFVCLRYCKDQALAEDALQESFIKVFGSLPKYTNTGSLEGWVRRIVVNTCLDFLRKEKSFADTISIENVEFKIYDDLNASESLELEDLMKIINQLPKGYKVVFNLFAIEGYSHKEIADLLGISEDTSKSQYFRARTFLRNYLEKTELK